MLFFENYQDYAMKDITRAKGKPVPTQTSQVLPEGQGGAQFGQNPCAEISLTGSMKCELNPYHPFRDLKHKTDYNILRKNLETEINKAGGTLMGIDFNQMTVFELLSTLCTNNISFKYNVPFRDSDKFYSTSEYVEDYIKKMLTI